MDWNLVRKTICNEVKSITGLQCILAEPEEPSDRRPELPYFTLKLTTPAAKVGDDSYSASSAGTEQNPSSVFDFGGTRRITANLECYGRTHEEAFDYASLVQASLDTIPVQGQLRANAGLAVWRILDITDLSQLLNTGYEGRALLEVYLGVVSNVSADLGSIESAPVSGEIFSDSGTDFLDYTVTEE